MLSAPDINDLSRQVAVLEERMNTMQADLSATLERFRADMAARDAEAAGRDAALSERLSAATDRLAAATDSMASSRWWQTAVIVSVVLAAMALVVALY